MPLPPSAPRRAASPPNLWPAVVQGWLVLSILGQLSHVAAFPMLVWGFRLSWPGQLLVAFVRLGVYSGLLWGISRGSRSAVSALVVELARTFLVFIVVTRLQEQMLFGVIHPAGWTQGLLSVALPAILVLNTGLSAGWQPGPELVQAMQIAAQVLAGICGWSAFWLARRPGVLMRGTDRQSPPSDPASPPSPAALVMEGLPAALLLTAVEIVGLQLTRR